MDRTVLDVDLGAIRRNWRTVCGAFSGERVGAVVKQDAYGLGADRIVPLLASLGCRDFWVVSFEEGVSVRALAPEARIFVLHGLAGAPAADFRCHSLIPVLVDAAELPVARAEVARAGRFQVALQFDTGLSRLGLTLADIRRLKDDPDALAGLDLAAYVTHLARFADPLARRNSQQWRRFRAWSGALPVAPLSFCASAGVFGPPARHGAVARVGSALYGVETTPSRPQPIVPAARLTAPILRVMEVPAGREVGYGGIYRTGRASRLAHVAAGYGDGLPFAFRHQPHVRLGAHMAPMVGGIAMNLMTLDVTDLPDGVAVPGARVELFGPDAPVGELAAAAGVAPNAIMVPAAHRARRVYRDDPPEGDAGLA
ncbi:alanine racemase [Xanthobacteraceae bacterium A53D]